MHNTTVQELEKIKENLEHKQKKIKEMKKNYENNEKNKEELSQKNIKITSEIESKLTELSNFNIENNESKRR